MAQILADATTTGTNISQTVIMVAIFALFSYFVLWRPDKKRRERMQLLRNNLKKGDIVIAMGIRATVDEVHERTVILKQCDGSKIEMLTAAISEIETKIHSPTVEKD